MFFPTFLKSQLLPPSFLHGHLMPANPRKLDSKHHKHKFSVLHKTSNDMRNQKSMDLPPDFTKKCHYTFQIYPCGHKTWLNKPRIFHLHPYCLLAHLADPLVSSPSSTAKTHEQGGNKFSKTRCTNMATKPREVQMTATCAKCQPVKLGVADEKKGFGEYQTLFGDADARSFGVDDIAQGVSRMSITDNKKEDIGKDAEGNSNITPKKLKKEEQLWETARQWPPEAHSDEGKDADPESRVDSDETKKEHRLEVTTKFDATIDKNAEHSLVVGSPEVREAEQDPKTVKESSESNDKADTGTKAAEVPARSLLGSFVNLFRAASKVPEVEPVDDDEPIEIWTEVGEDPDWDKIDGKDEQASTKDDDDEVWIKVKRG